MSDARAGATDINALIDEAPIGLLQLRVLVLGLVTMVFEGYNTYAVSYIGPQLTAAWHIAPSTLGIVFTSGVIGSAVAYLGVGPASDRIGRRLLIVGGVCSFGLATLASATATSPAVFIAWRIVSGLALGATLPNIVAITAEFAPARWRGFSVVILYSGFAIGAATSGRLTSYLVPSFGWPSVFIAGGSGSLLLAAVMQFTLPESIRFLALQRTGDPRLRNLLMKISADPVAGTASHFHLAGEAPSRKPFSDLFRDGRALSTILIWLVLAMGASALDSLVFWLPTLAHAAGVPDARAINFTVVMLLGGIAGAYLVGFCMDKIGAYLTLIPVATMAGILILGAGSTLQAPPLLLAAALGVCLPGGISGAQGLLARLYPTSIRATGIGWATGTGRFIGIGAPLLVGLLAGQGWAPQTVIYALASPAFIAAAALVLLSRDSYGRKAALRHATPDVLEPAGLPV